MPLTIAFSPEILVDLDFWSFGAFSITRVRLITELRE